MKRAVCLILAFLMLTGSVDPGCLLPVSRAEALEAAEQSVCAASEDASPAAQEESAADAAEPEEESHASEETPEEPEKPEKEAEEVPDAPEETDKDAGETPDADEEEGKEAGETPDASEESGKEAGETPDASEEEGKEAGEAPDASEKSDKEAEAAPDASEKSDKEAEAAPDASEKSDKEAEEAPDASQEADEEAEEAADTSEEAPDTSEEGGLLPQTTATGTVKLSGVVEYVDEPFTELIRPEENPTLVVVPIYKDEYDEYKDADVKWSTQGDDSSQQGYIFFYPPTSDNYFSGAVAFDIYNLPRTVEVNGDKTDVVKYRVEPVFSEPSYYYQKNKEKATTADLSQNSQTGTNVLQTIEVVDIHPISCKSFTLCSNVIPNDAEATSFPWEVTFTRPDTNKTLVMEFDTDNGGVFSLIEGFCIIPSGLHYTAVQKRPTNGNFRFANPSDTQVTVEDGIIPGPKEACEIICDNYLLNMSLPFTVDWKDNDDVKETRPKNADSCFTLQVRKKVEEEAAWTPFPTDSTELETTYGITSAPTLTVKGNNYEYTGLPGADAENNVLEYRVECKAPDNYTANNEKEAYIGKNEKFTMRLSHSYTAYIEWMDDNNTSGFRPTPTPTPSDSTGVTTTLSSLRLYSRGSDGTVTDLTDTSLPGNKNSWVWTSSGATVNPGDTNPGGTTFSSTDNTWILTVPGLATYTDDNEEIEYFLVHGTDLLDAQGKETEVQTATRSTSQTGTIYTPHYDNGTGSYASDELRCHDKNKITMLLSSETAFSTTVEWKDDNELTNTIPNRPSGTVTLWRYAHYLKDDGTEATLDDAFEAEKASQVVYVGADGKEHPLCFDLPAGSTGATLTAEKDPNTNQDTITFTYTDKDGNKQPTTITGTLPGHDSAGREYTYFVRETLTGDNKHHYSVSYSHTDYTGAEPGAVTPYKEGAPNGGKITNTRREKALVTVDKTWRNPDGVAEIDGAKVQLKLFASIASESGNAEELDVYSEEEDSYDILTGNDLTKSQTATGFTDTIPTAQKSYYVNIYDNNGLPYDMQNAVLVETVTLSDTNAGRLGITSPIAQSGNFITLGTGENEKKYVVTTHFVAERSDTEPDSEPKRYHYDQFNTIASKRTYDVIKHWAVNDEASQPYLNNIQAVVVELQRCLVKDLNKPSITWTKVYDHVLIYPDSNQQWKTTLDDLDKYDENGNAYYYSANELGFLVEKTTSTDDKKVPSGAAIGSITIDAGPNNGQTFNNFVPFHYYTTLDPTWGHSYSRTEQETVVSNHDNPGSGYFSICKSWKDNNDKDRPDSVTIRIYDRSDLYNAVETKTGDVNWSELDSALITPVREDDTVAATADIVLSASGYMVDQTYKSLCNNQESVARNKHIWDYVVLEYKVGNGDPATYTYEQIAQLAAPFAGSNEDHSTDAASAKGTADYHGNDPLSQDDDRDYDVTVSRNPSRETYYILNERTGTTTLELTKNWNDENNCNGLRPNSVEFKLYRDGALCAGTDENDDVTAVLSDPNNIKVEPAGAGIKVTPEMSGGKFTGTFNAQYTGTNGANTKPQWKITVDNLPMFSGDSGMLYAYNIDEQNELASNAGTTTGDGATVHYHQTRGAVQTEVKGSHQTFSIELKNTVSGTTTHTAYKYWKDTSVEPKDLRPSLVFTLYRYRKAAYSSLRSSNQTLPEHPTYDQLASLNDTEKETLGFEKVTDHNDPVMTTKKDNPEESATSTAGNPKYYDWKIEINDLQRFDSQGREYAYVLREQMGNNGETVRGKYVGTTERTPVVTGPNVKEYDEFTNTITGNLTLSGVKIWKGHENYQVVETDLPEPDVTLYRTTDDDLSKLSDLNLKTDSEIKALVKEGKLLRLDRIHMGKGTRYEKSYVFPSYEKQESDGAVPIGMKRVGDKLMLPKYDDSGKRYTYLMRETLTDIVANQLYAKTASTGTLVNTLNPNINRRTIKIYKSWQDRLGDTYHNAKYPSVTFELYRDLYSNLENQNINTHAQHTQPYATQTINSAYFKPETNENGAVCCEFKDLLVYSPKGELYGYYVKEKLINGYQSEFSLTKPTNGAGAGIGTSTGDGPDLDSETDTGTGTGTGSESGSGTGTGTGSESGSGTGTESGNAASNSQDILVYSDVFSDKDGWDSDTGINNELYAQNTYTPSKFPINLSGTKVWNDWHDVAGMRPDNLTITLKRSTTSESGQNNNIESHEVKDVTVLGPNDPVPADSPWIKWKTTGEQDSLGRDMWTYEVGGLPKYAPNGMAYLYTITENAKLDGYQDLTNRNFGTKTDEETGKENFSPITNSLETNFIFRKYWHDGSNAYNLRPDKITIVLQYSMDNGTTWQDMPYDEKYELYETNQRTGDSKRWFRYNNPSGSHDGAIAVELTASDVPGNSNDINTWQYKFLNLPSRWKENGVVKDVKYRCVEVKVGAAEVNYTSTELSGTVDTEKEHIAGAYKAKYQPLSNNMNAVENHLDSSKLKVTKVWQGDQHNLYNSRPASVKFKLQKKVNYENVSGTGSTPTWVDVLLSDGTPYIITLSSDNVDANDSDRWECTLEDLPVGGVDDTGSFSLEFRAVELHEDIKKDDGTVVVSVEPFKNYEDLMDYADESKDGHTFDINNHDERNTSVITNELKTAGQTITANKVWYSSPSGSDQDIKATFELQYMVHGSSDEWQSYSPQKLTQTLSKTANGTSVSLPEPWTNVPRYDRDGNELEYRIIEQMGEDGHPVTGYALVSSSTTYDAGAGEAESTGDGDLGDEDPPASTPTPPTEVTTFVNVELQTYTVTKTWNKPGADANGAAYVPKSSGGFTSTFVLQQKIGDGAWTDCTLPNDAQTQTLTGDGDNVNYTWTELPKYTRYTWTELPKYTREGITITYRAVETQINGNVVTTINGNDTDGNYIVTYDYDDDGDKATKGTDAPAFDDTQTDATNRLVYGFVDLSKTAAYLASGGTPEKLTDAENNPQKLSGIVFNIEKKEGENYTPYATGITTDANGRLNHTTGKYGTEQKYLIPGTYRLVEASTQNDYSLWHEGVEFTVGLNGTTDTGEHGTAWISTDTTAAGGLTLAVSYLRPENEPASHHFNDSCGPNNNSAAAYNLESRGVIEFTKKGLNGANLDTHTGSSGETPAYFGVYTNAACTTQVAGMMAKSDDKTAFVLTDTEQNGSTKLTQKKGEIPYLRQYGGNYTLLSGTYYVRELVAPAGYKVDTTVREVKIANLDTPMDGSTNLTSFYVSNRGSFTKIGDTSITPDVSYQWPNTPNKVTIYKMDQFGRNVDLNGGYLELKFDEGFFPTGENTIRLYQSASKPATKTNGTTRVGSGSSGSWSIAYSDNAWTITGLFDMGKQYTLSEPDGVAPDENIQAKPITFTIGGDGQMSLVGTNSHISQIPTGTDIKAASGRDDDYNNYYQQNADNNLVVLRDVARFRKNVALKKLITGTTTPIQYISFNLYHVIHNSDGTNTEELVTDPPLTTGADGVIDLSQLDIRLKNRVTGSPLNKGLDLGDYFFREVEMGASDGYRLVEDIPFKIKAVTPENPETADYADYAEVMFTTSSTVTQSEAEKPDRGTVCNAPVQDKSLKLTKKDEDGTTLLSGARFKLEYVSITNGTLGSKTSSGALVATPSVITTYAMTDTNGKLKTAVLDKNGNWTIGGSAPDISAKGTYTLTELRASPEHMTYTANGTTAIPVMLQFFVDSNNEIQCVSGESSYILDAFTGTGLVDAPTVGSGDAGDLTVTVKNNKTVVTIDKLNDLYQNTKTENQHNLSGEALTGAKLEIYQGVGTSGKVPISQNYTSDAGAGEGTASGDGPSLDDDDDGSSGTSNAGAGIGGNSGDHDLGNEDGSSSGSSGGSSSVTSGNTWTLTGILSENTVYTLHEKEAPVGFLEANDLYFCLFGTRTVGNSTESQLYIWIGSGDPPATVTPADLIDGTNWSKARNPENPNDTTNLDNDNDLTMVDEAIIAPVDARKVLETGSPPLAGATFTVSVSGGAELGTVVSGSDGYLKWETLNVSNLNGLVYNSDGKRVAAEDDATGQTVILRQNDAGYTFKEASAPINAYNEGIGKNQVYRVKITDQNYIDYKEQGTNRVNWAVDLVDAENNTPNHTADLKDKTSETSPVSNLVNPPYHSTVTLHKYDIDPETNQTAIPGTEFTLYQGNTTTVYTNASMGGDVHTNGVFTTDSSGNLSITIPEKGSYTLEETQAAPGYKLDASNSFSFTLVDKSSDGKFDYDNTTPLEKNTTGVPNERQYGTITLTKTDAAIGSVALDGVVYTLERTDKPDEITQYFNDATQYVSTGKTYTADYSGTGAARRCTLTEQPGQTGKITISGLDWGTYTLTETTSLSGYRLETSDHTKTFTIGSTSLTPAAQSDTNSKNSVKFKKTEYDNSTKVLPGAVFKVLNESNQEVSFYPSETDTTTTNWATSDANGVVTVYGLPTDPDSDTATTYKLVEVTAPAGYVLNPTPVTFSIDRYGNVKMGDSSVSEVPMADKPIRVTLKKLGEEGTGPLDGAEFTLTPDNGSRFVDNTSSKTLTLSGGTLLIEKTLIGGNSYILEETKAPDGYEATAKIYFTVATDGQVTIDSTRTTGGYGTTCCTPTNELWASGSTGEYKSTLSIRDEKIRVTLTKVDRDDASTKLNEVEFTLTPCTGSSFASGFESDPRLVSGVFTATTDTNGVITIPDGLLVHGCTYLLQEISIPAAMRYYLGREASTGVKLKVAPDGKITVENGSADCPVSVNNADGHVQLTAKNPKAAVFEFTKAVAGNMGDVTGSFEITMEVYEPDKTTKIATKTVTLKKGEGYSSVRGTLATNGTTVMDGSLAFGENAIPKSGWLRIIENAEQDYDAQVNATSLQYATVDTANKQKGEVWLRLTEDYTQPARFTLTNTKNVSIDAGVVLEQNAPYALIAIAIPALWLYLRARRRRKGGGDR